MKYLCMKQLTVGNKTFHPGEVIPDGIILPERTGKLKSFGYISPVYDTDLKDLESVQNNELEKENNAVLEKQEAKIKKSRKVSEEVKE